MTTLRTATALIVWLASIVAIDSFAPALHGSKESRHVTLHVHRSLRHTKLHGSSRGDGVTFQYSPIFLEHLKNVELPRDYSRPWTMQKIKAAMGALALGGTLGVGGNLVVHNVFDIDAERISLLFGAAGLAGGWFLLGGKEIAESELPMNGGLDARLIADRPSRLRTTVEFLEQQPNVVIQESNQIDDSKILSYVTRVHDESYVQELRKMSLASDCPRRLNPLYARTLVDEHSYGAAVQAVGAWIHAVDSALDQSPTFCLVRPPSHHACRGKGKGGCLLNSVAIAAMYALDRVKSVAILDIDAHHGNGIAHCVQDEPRIRYCSIHENSDKQQPLFVDKKKSLDDPRSPSSDDHGPLGNILNINLPSGTTWDDGYAEALETQAMPFLCENQSDLLLVAAGFDALEDDWSSSLKLQTVDYAKLGLLLKEKFGNRVAFGLEGGYAYQNGKLAEAINEFVKPWKQQ